MQSDDIRKQHGRAALKPITRAELPALAAAGLEGLAALVSECQAAQTKAERFSALGAYMQDPDLVASGSAAWAHNPSAVQGALMRLSGVPGLTGVIPQLRKALSSAPVSDGDNHVDADLRREVPAGLRIPEAWTVDAAGITTFQVKDGIRTPVVVTTRPLIPTAILKDGETGGESVQIEWRKRGGWDWDRMVLPASRVQDARTLTAALSDAGAPVGQHNGKQVGRYLHDVIEASGDLPAAWASKSCGWTPGNKSFLWGQTLITKAGYIKHDASCTEWGPDHAILLDSDSDAVKALHSAGDFDTWRALASSVIDSPAAAMAIYGALVPPLLGILEAQNPILDWSGLSSTGKTTLLWVGGSAWGDPSDRGGFVHSWETTPYRFEQSASLLNGLPLLMDDTKRAANQEDLEKYVYMYSHGIGKGRGGLDGKSRPTMRWRGALLSTGEARLLARGTSGGSRARALQIEDAPFPDFGKNEVEPLRAGLLENYGWAGPAFVRWLLLNRERWPGLLEYYEERCAFWRAEFDSGVGVRLGRCVALHEVVASIVHAERGPIRLAMPKGGILPRAAEWIRASAGEADRAAIALLDLHGWASQHQSEFWGRHVTDANGPRQPSRGWAGAWVPVESWESIAFVRGALDRILLHLGHHPAEVVRAWSERGWLVSEPGRGTKKITVGTTERPRCVCVSRAAVDALD